MKKSTVLLPKAQKAASILGENIRLARLRRKFSTQQVSERANISRPTLVSIEKGNPNVSIGAYIKVLFVLGLEKDITNIAKDDELGRRLQDAKLITKERAPKIKIKNPVNGGKE
jgi:transcriptional regulator with XRE-family HTH domain